MLIPYLEEGSLDTSTKHDIWLTQGLTLTPFEGFVFKSDFSYNTFFQTNEEVLSKIEVIGGSDFINGIDLTNVFLDNGFSGDDYITNTNFYNQYFVFNTYGEYTL